MFLTDAKIRVSKIFGAKNGPKINFFRKKSPNVAFFNKGGGVGWLFGLMRYFSSCMSGKIFLSSCADDHLGQITVDYYLVIHANKKIEGPLVEKMIEIEK